MHIKFEILNKILEWFKKRSLFAYRGTEKNFNTLAATLLKLNYENNST